MTPVIHHHVGQMQYAKSEMELDRVLVYLNILVILTPVVDQNVCLIPIVIDLEHVLIINAKTLAREHVASMPSAV